LLIFPSHSHAIEKLKKNLLTLIATYDQMESAKDTRDCQAAVVVVFQEARRIYPNAIYWWYESIRSSHFFFVYVSFFFLFCDDLCLIVCLIIFVLFRNSVCPLFPF
jgi:hypothetical protein